MRRYGKTDDNQPLLVRQLRQIGASVQSLASVGQGCPDLVVGYQGDNYLLEIKNDKLCPSARGMTPEQHIWHGQWHGQVGVVETIDDCVQVFERRIRR